MTTVQEVNAAVLEMHKRLAKAGVVLSKVQHNGAAFTTYLLERELDAGNVDNWIKAYHALVQQQGVLQFERGKEPEAYRKPAPLPGTLSAIVDANKAVEVREKAARAQEQKEAEAKKEIDAERDVNATIASFQLTKGGNVRYALTEEYQKAMRGGVSNLRAKGHTFVEIVPVVKGWVQTRYTEWEAENSKL